MTGQEHTGPPVHLPDPTPWPMVLALGITLLAATVVVHQAGLLGGSPVVTLLMGGLGGSLFLVSLLRLIREDIELYDFGEDNLQ